MPLRNIAVLLICQLISATGAFVMVSLGGIIGASLAPNPSLATLPVSTMVVFLAATTIPATLLMKRIGRPKGFAVASLCSVLSCLLAGYALSMASFTWFMVATSLFGVNMAFTQQYRFAAIESVPTEFAARAISFVLLGALGGAIAGKELVSYGQFVIADVPYAGTLVALSGLYFLQSLLFSLLDPLRGAESEAGERAPRELVTVIRQPVFVIAVAGGTVAYGVMTFIMTATPISMHVIDGYSVEVMTSIIRNHVLAMYGPSLISGYLIDRLGVAKMMTFGAVGLLAACIVGFQGQAIMHYWFALVLLGVGWNFLYVGGTTMLSYTYSMPERFKAQAVNEFCVSGISATASFLAGTIMYFYGWYALVIAPLPLLAAILVGLFLVRRNPLLVRRVTDTA